MVREEIDRGLEEGWWRLQREKLVNRSAVDDGKGRDELQLSGRVSRMVSGEDGERQTNRGGVDGGNRRDGLRVKLRAGEEIAKRGRMVRVGDVKREDGWRVRGGRSGDHKKRQDVESR